jgi:hypothetical protein
LNATVDRIEKNLDEINPQSAHPIEKEFSKENISKVDSLRSEIKLMYDYIDRFKDSLLGKKIGSQINSNFLLKKENISELKTKINNYKRFLIKKFPQIITDLDKKINTDNASEDGANTTWESYYFSANLPVAAILQYLQIIKDNIKNIERNIELQLN